MTINPIGPLATLRSLAILLVSIAVALLVGIISGYYATSKWEDNKRQAAVGKALTEVRKIDSASISNAQRQSETIAAQVEETRSTVTSIQQAARDNFKQQEKKRTVRKLNREKGKTNVPEAPPNRPDDETTIIRGSSLLDNVTACLLDAARRQGGTDDCPSAGGDDQSQIATDTEVIPTPVHKADDGKVVPKNPPTPMMTDTEVVPSAVTFEEFVENDLEVVKQYNELAARHNALVDYVKHLQEEQKARLGIMEQ